MFRPWGNQGDVMRVRIGILAAAIIAVAVAAATIPPKPGTLVVPISRPPGTIRWDTPVKGRFPQPTPGPVPATYTLGGRISTPHAISVDGLGRFYILDHGRGAVIRFTRTGELDGYWPDGIDDWDSVGRDDISVTTDGTIFLGPCGWWGWDNVRRIRPEETGSGAAFPVLLTQASCVAARDDGSYCEWAYEPGVKKHVDKSSSAISTYSTDGKLVTSWFALRVSGLAYGPDGLIYSMEDGGTPLGPRIVVYDDHGTETRTIPLDAMTDQGDNGHLDIDRNGDIYFAAGEMASDAPYIYRLDSKGNPIARWSPYRTADAPDKWEFGDFAVRDGLIYAIVTSDTTREIQAFTPDGQCIARYAAEKHELDLPSYLAVQPDGSCAVVQQSDNHTLLVYDASGAQIASLTEYQPITAIGARPSGGYYVSRYYDMEIIGADSKKTGNLYHIGEPDGDFDAMAVQMAVDAATGNVWGLGSSGVISTYDPSGKRINRFPESRELNLPTFSLGLAVDPKGFLYIPDTRRHRIIKCDFNGKILAKWGKKGEGLGELMYPQGVLVDDQGRLFVADTGNSRIQVFSSDGESLGFWGKLGTGEGELDRPLCITFGGTDTLWIADTHNDRIVKVPLADLWKQLTKEIMSPPPYVAPEKVPMPVPGEVTVEGIVVAGTDDFTDCVYIQAADRSWGTRVTMPANVPANRGDRIKVTGTLELKEHSARYLQASKSEYVLTAQSMPGPLGMANLYVGDGYRMGDKPSDLSNLGLLVKSWGRVLMADPLNKRFVISDGSRLGNGAGLEVYGGQLKSPITQWPKFGQYVMVTGISAVRPTGNGTFQPAIRLRAQEDLQVLENG